MTTERLIEEFVDVGLEVADEGVLPKALDELAARLAAEPSALGRVRLIATTECRTPPDMGGLCMACGRKIAPVAGHKPGCDPFARVRRLVIRLTRLSRLYRRAARGEL